MKKFRLAVFVVGYSIENKKISYILLKRKLHWKGWEFPKGKIEDGEKDKETALRELKEETGLKINKKSLKDYKLRGKYNYHKLLPDRPDYKGQTWHLFSVEVKKGKIKLGPKEHNGFIWLDFEKAVKKLTWPNQKKCLKIVNKYLTKK